MKHIIMLIAANLLLCLPMQALNRTVTLKNNQGEKLQVIELHDTVIDGKQTTDTLSITTYENPSSADEEEREASNIFWNKITYSQNHRNDHFSETLVSIIAIIAVFGMPVFILFIIFYYRNKQRKAKYRLAEQILASGQPLPENFFKNETGKDLRSKGINNIFLGLGLFIFLWAITESFGMGSIGLLIMLTGIGQVVIYHSQQPSSKSPFIHIERNQTNGKKSVKIGGIVIDNQQKEESKEESKEQ